MVYKAIYEDKGGNGKGGFSLTDYHADGRPRITYFKEVTHSGTIESVLIAGECVALIENGKPVIEADPGTMDFFRDLSGVPEKVRRVVESAGQYPQHPQQ